MLFLEQIRHAHLIVANKIDLLTEVEASNVTMQIQALNSTLQLFKHLIVKYL